MTIDLFLQALKQHEIDFFTGVPDSQLKALCDELMSRYGIHPEHHIVAHNEGGSVGLAAGYHLAGGKVPCVYMQNSGIGNTVNPVASLTNPAVYGIPTLYVIGWRGEPGVKDEPQHVFQGAATQGMLEVLNIETVVLDKESTAQTVQDALERFEELFRQGKSAAFLVRKGALEAGPGCVYENPYTIVREDAVRAVAQAAGEGIVVSTTGKISRELFEIREADGFGHAHDFLTVGSMGHSAMIALGIALQKKDVPVWCIDGDGAVLMHMGALGVVGSRAPRNFVHVVLNNAAHETVGGVDTVADTMDLPAIALASGYAAAFVVDEEKELEAALRQAKRAAEKGPVLLDVHVAMGSRSDLGRPTTTPHQNKESFMAFLQEDSL